LCSSEQELSEFKENHCDDFKKILSIHKQKRARINFIVVPSALGANGFSTEHEQFILLENFVIVLEGFERVLARGNTDIDTTYITGYVSWNVPDLNFYRLFVQEIEKLQIKPE
jgi:hypothetical protein